MLFGVPNAAEEVETVFGNGRQIDYAEVRAVRRPCVVVVGRRLTDVVEASPYKLPHGPRQVVLHGEIVVGRVTPTGVLHVVARALEFFAVSSGAESVE